MPEGQGNGTALGHERLTADEAIEAVLKLEMEGARGWELTPEARAELANIVKGLKAQRLARDLEEQASVAVPRVRCSTAAPLAARRVSSYDGA